MKRFLTAYLDLAAHWPQLLLRKLSVPDLLAIWSSSWLLPLLTWIAIGRIRPQIGNFARLEDAVIVGATALLALIGWALFWVQRSAPRD